MPKILLLGGTGAMGVYLVPELLRMGHDVAVTSRSARVSDNEKLTYIRGNARDDDFLAGTIRGHYDAIVDFMVYPTTEFHRRHELLLKNTGHYVFLSSCRVFAESDRPMTEASPRLLDVSKDREYLATEEYALAKARQENILRESRHRNWTIVRPAITYSRNRFQLGTLEADMIVFRASCHCPVILPREMLRKQTTMTWGGDVARMIARLVCANNVFAEDYNACTGEHRTWEEVARYYKELIGLTVVPVELDAYIKIMGGKYQVLYGRMIDKIMDNSKILNATGMRNADLMSIRDGLARELAEHSTGRRTVRPDYETNAKIDRITHSHISMKHASVKERVIYYGSYIGIQGWLRSIRRSMKKRHPVVAGDVCDDLRKKRGG